MSFFTNYKPAGKSSTTEAAKTVTPLRKKFGLDILRRKNKTAEAESTIENVVKQNAEEAVAHVETSSDVPVTNENSIAAQAERAAMEIIKANKVNNTDTEESIISTIESEPVKVDEPSTNDINDDSAPISSDNVIEEKDDTDLTETNIDTKAADNSNKETDEPKKVTRKRATRKKKAAEETKTTNDVPADTVAIPETYRQDIPTLEGKLSYDELAGRVLSYFSDDDWKKVEDHFMSEIRSDKFRFDADINLGSIDVMLSELNNLYLEIFPYYVETKKLATCNDKNGMIRAARYENSVGTNDIDRKRNGFLALRNYPVGDSTVDFIVLSQAVTMRLVFIEGIIAAIENIRRLAKQKQELILGTEGRLMTATAV